MRPLSRMQSRHWQVQDHVISRLSQLSQPVAAHRARRYAPPCAHARRSDLPTVWGVSPVAPSEDPQSPISEVYSSTRSSHERSPCTAQHLSKINIPEQTKR